MLVRDLEQNEMEVQSSVAETATGREAAPTTARAAPTGAQAGGPPPTLDGVRRPVPALLRYYFLQSLLTGPGLLVLMPLRYFRYRTLHYVFDDEGVTMRWGLLFRREVTLTYARIQDIHLVSNVIERWLGIGRVQIQTASGKSGAEMTIEGLADYEAVRDRLYGRMRGARDAERRDDGAAPDAAPDAAAASLAPVVSALEDAVAELRALRADLAALGREPR